MKCLPWVLLLATVATPALRAETSGGSVDARAWAPPLVSDADVAVQIGAFNGMSLRPLQATSAGHPWDPPATSGAQASLSFERPAYGDADYHSLAAAYAFSYTPFAYIRSARTEFQLSGWLKILPGDMQLLLGLLPPAALVSFQTDLLLEGLLLAESSTSGLQLSWTLDGHTLDGALELQSSAGGDPVPTASGLLADAADVNLRTFGEVELEGMFPGVNVDFGMHSARGAGLLSVDRRTDTLLFVANSNGPFGGGPILWYETPLAFSMTTWADTGDTSSSVALVDLRDTLHFSFTVLDAQGQATTIPVYLDLQSVPEPGALWLGCAGGSLLWFRLRRARQRTRAAAAP
jgi:hypothetical protein